MYGIFTYIWVIFRANVGKYSIHGAYGMEKKIWKTNLHGFHGYVNLALDVFGSCFHGAIMSRFHVEGSKHGNTDHGQKGEACQQK